MTAPADSLGKWQCHLLEWRASTTVTDVGIGRRTLDQSREVERRKEKQLKDGDDSDEQMFAQP